MDKVELKSRDGKVHAQISDEAKEELAKSGIDSEREIQSIIQCEEDRLMQKERRNHVTRREYNTLNFILTAVLLVTALFAWRVTARHNENVRNIAKICDKVGIEYSISTNHFGLRNNIILK